MTELTKKQRDELRRMYEKATPVPWAVDKTNALGAYGIWDDGVSVHVCRMGDENKKTWLATTEERTANAAYIVAACNTLPSLLDAIDAAEAREAKLRAVCQRLSDAWSSSSSATTWDALNGNLVEIVRDAREALAKE